MDKFEVVETTVDGTPAWVIRWTRPWASPELIERSFKTRQEAQEWADRLASIG